jgi:predicted nucleotidyltransferase
MTRHLNNINETILPVFERYANKIVCAYLFGSVVKGEVYPLSDVDIAVYLKEGTGEDYFEVKLALYADLCRALKRNDVDLVVLNTTANLMLLGDIVRNGVVIYDSNPAVREDYEIKILHRFIDFKTHRSAVMGI